MIFYPFFGQIFEVFVFSLHANAFHYIDYGQWNFNSSLSFSLCLSILFLSPLVSVFNFAISGTLFAKISVEFEKRNALKNSRIRSGSVELSRIGLPTIISRSIKMRSASKRAFP